MSNTDERWIKMSERKPTKEDLPVFSVGDEKPEAWQVNYWRDNLPVNCVYWCRARIPSMPVKELTQQQKDARACVEWLAKNEDVFTPFSAWHAALAYRDNQNRKDLDRIPVSVKSVLGFEEFDYLGNLRRRTGMKDYL